MKRSMPFFNDSFSKQKTKFTALKNKLTNKKEEIKEENSFYKSLKKDYNILDQEEKKEPELAQLLLEKVNKLEKKNVLEKRPFAKEDFSFLDESFNSVQLIENSLKNENLINFNSIFNKKLGEKEKIKRLKKVSIPLKEQCSFLDLALEVKIEKIKFSELKLKGIKKVAEASFSDVYLHDSVIYKVIPLDVGDKPNLDDFIKETYIHQTISKEKGVCKLKKVYLAKGKYSSYFLKAWEEFKKEKGTDNQNPTEYPKNNLFGIFVLEECGIDLEKYIFKSKEEVFCILNQIFRTISHLEKVYEFEHRDLHWGNILIKDSQIKIIDFSLARITKKKVIFIDLKNKEWLFSGNEKTDEQFGIYKKMKILTNDDWMIHTPKNNVLWLVYLINKIILLTNNKLRVSTFLNKIKSLVKNCKSAVDAYEALKNVL